MKQIFEFYNKKKTLSWLIIVITSYIEPTLLIIWISLITYALVKKIDLFSSKIDKKFKSKEWDKKMKNLNKDWDVKLKKIEKGWKKNPKKALLPILGILVGVYFIFNFSKDLTAKNYSKFSYIVYDCGGDLGSSYGQMYNYWYLDKERMNAMSESWVEQFPQKTIQNRKILSWGKKIVMENIKTASEPYFKNDELWMLGDGRLVSGWYSSPCKILEQN